MSDFPGNRRNNARVHKRILINDLLKASRTCKLRIVSFKRKKNYYSPQIAIMYSFNIELGDRENKEREEGGAEVAGSTRVFKKKFRN